MPRDVDEKKTRKALRKLRRAAERAETEGIELTDWEREFVEGVDERLETYGSAFADPTKGASGEALSNAQSEILRQLDKKSRGKGHGGFKTRKPLSAKKGFKPKTRDVECDEEQEIQEAETEHFVPNMNPFKAFSQTSHETRPSSKDDKRPAGRPQFRVIDGGKSDP